MLCRELDMDVDTKVGTSMEAEEEEQGIRDSGGAGKGPGGVGGSGDKSRGKEEEGEEGDSDGEGEEEAGEGEGEGGEGGEEKEWLPSELNPQRCGSFLHVAPDKLQAEYTGDGKHENDVGAIQANFPAPTRRMVYYFEVAVKCAGKRGCIAVGFSDRAFKTCKQPGWEPNSYGYHGDDGKACHGGLREPYGPQFGASDVVGAGINYLTHTIFFTVNRKFLGTAFRDIKGELFPTVGLHSYQEKVEVNFGQKPFLFDIEGFILEEREKRRRAISHIPLPTLIPNSVIRSYLLFYGYKDTLEAFDGAYQGSATGGAAGADAGAGGLPLNGVSGTGGPGRGRGKGEEGGERGGGHGVLNGGSGSGGGGPQRQQGQEHSSGATREDSKAEEGGAGPSGAGELPAGGRHPATSAGQGAGRVPPVASVAIAAEAMSLDDMAHADVAHADVASSRGPAGTNSGATPAGPSASGLPTPSLTPHPPSSDASLQHPGGPQAHPPSAVAPGAGERRERGAGGAGDLGSAAGAPGGLRRGAGAGVEGSEAAPALGPASASTSAFGGEGPRLRPLGQAVGTPQASEGEGARGGAGGGADASGAGPLTLADLMGVGYSGPHPGCAAATGAELEERILRSSLSQRAHIRRLIRQGDADGAMQKLFEWCPQVLQDDKWGVTFLLRATKFVELVKGASPDAAVRFARSELARFRGLSQQQDAALEECLALLAYEDPWGSPLAFLLQPQQREKVADVVNQAILSVALPQPQPLWRPEGGEGPPGAGVPQGERGGAPAAAGTPSPSVPLGGGSSGGASSAGAMHMPAVSAAAQGVAVAFGAAGGRPLVHPHPQSRASPAPPLMAASPGAPQASSGAPHPQPGSGAGAGAGPAAGVGAGAGEAGPSSDPTLSLGSSPVPALRSGLETLLRQLATAHWELRELQGAQGEVFSLRRILRGQKDGGW